MEDIINLECKYYLKNVKEDLNNIKLVDINTLKPYKISKNEEYFIKIDFNESYKHILRISKLDIFIILPVTFIIKLL